jgi:hypothetical protein
MEHDVETPVDGQFVRFTTTFTSPRWEDLRTSRSVLRFLDRDAVSAFLAAAGLVVEKQFGDWDGSPPSETAPEIITIARPA